MSGDTVMTGSFPIFGQPVWDEGLQDEQWLETIDRIMGIVETEQCSVSTPIIPGHDPLAGKKEIDLLVRIQNGQDNHRDVFTPGIRAQLMQDFPAVFYNGQACVVTGGFDTKNEHTG